mgnify:CR=1 FL=1
MVAYLRRYLLFGNEDALFPKPLLKQTQLEGQGRIRVDSSSSPFKGDLPLVFHPAATGAGS